MFEQRYGGGGERPSVTSSVSSSVCSDGEPWFDDGHYVDGAMVLESADQLARQVNQAWEYATEVASRPVTAACDVRSPSAAEASLPGRRRCSRAAMLAAELAGGDTAAAAAASVVAAPVISPRRLRSAGTASAPGVRAPQQRPASSAGRPTTASVVTHRIPLIHLQSLGHPNPTPAPSAESHPSSPGSKLRQGGVAGQGGVSGQGGVASGVASLKPRGAITSAAMCKAALAQRRSGGLSRPQTADPASGYHPGYHPASNSRHGGGGAAGGGGGGAAGGGRAERPSSALAAYACVWGECLVRGRGRGRGRG